MRLQIQAMEIAMTDKNEPVTFISPATKYDLYVGSKDWNELTPEQQDKIILNEMTGTNDSSSDYIMACDLKKSQAGGLRSLLVHCGMLLERMGKVKDCSTWDEHQAQGVLKLLDGTAVGHRLSEAFAHTANHDRTAINGAELEALEQRGLRPSVLDKTLDMPTDVAHSFVLAHLSESDRAQGVKPVATTSQNEQAPTAAADPASPTELGRFNKKSLYSFSDLVPRLFWKVFPPYEVRLTIEEIRSFLDGAMCRPLVEPLAIALAKNAKRTIYSIRIDGMKPDRLALLLITNVIGEQISSGSHHTNRGNLSIIGSDLLRTWSAAVSRLKERGYYTDDEAKEDMRWIEEKIAGAG